MQLNLQLMFFDEACKVPVLLSLFVAAFGDSHDEEGEEAASPTLPSNLFELYTLAFAPQELV